jgi:hypothetical protein
LRLPLGCIKTFRGFKERILQIVAPFSILDPSLYVCTLYTPFKKRMSVQDRGEGILKHAGDLNFAANKDRGPKDFLGRFVLNHHASYPLF